MPAGTGAGLFGLHIDLVVDDAVQHHVNLVSGFLRKQKLLATPAIFRVSHPGWSAVHEDFRAFYIIFLKTGVIISIATVFLTVKKRIVF